MFSVAKVPTNFTETELELRHMLLKAREARQDALDKLQDTEQRLQLATVHCDAITRYIKSYEEC